MATYQELMAQIDVLQAQAALARQNEILAAVEQVRTLVTQFGLTEDDVFPKAKVQTKSKSLSVPKYRNPATGATWTGKGRAPNWLQGDRSAYEI